MNKGIPTASKYLSQKWFKEDLERHKAHLRAVKGSIDRNEPAKFSHLKVKRKKNQLMEGKWPDSLIDETLADHSPCACSLERLTQIEKTNKILLEKMTRILKSSRT